MAETASQQFLARLSRRESVAIILVGSLVLIGWLLHVQVLKSALPGLIAMNPLSALLFIFTGCALLRAGNRARKRPDLLVLILGVIVLLGGATKIAECFFSFDLDLDQILFHRQVNSAGPYGPNEIAMNTALSFVCCGLALLLLDVQTKGGYRPAQGFILIVGLMALLALIGYGYRVLPLYSFGSQIPMALNSAICFELFAVAALSARPSRGLMMVITSDTTGGAMARRLLPAALLIPLILGALLFSSEKHGVFAMESGISLFAFANIVLFTTVIWWNAKLLFWAEEERLKAMEKLKQTTRDLERSNMELQQFAYVASHDLTEPLRMVVSYLELLTSRAREKLDSEDREFIGYAVDGARRMQTLIQDLLAYARVDTRGRPLEPTDCERVLETVLANLKLAIQESHTVIEHDPLPTVQGDVGQLTQVFQNLIGNAIKFRGKETPKIHVGARHENGQWIFHIRDNGIGINPKNFDRIFVLFQRLHTRQEYPGTGMGLAICKKIIERHGGRIWVDSQPGAGTTFFFTIPAKKENDE
ncbi:MAG TPA: ATP-binding protein [Verrucomicrobiae bacterium]|nr:ATP-binding protein [Verrucomicrobiae bacterium]